MALFINIWTATVIIMNINVNQIFCSEAISFMKLLPRNYIDLTVTSPPYGNLRDYKGYNFNFEGIAHELYRITKPGGVLVWIVSDQTINGSESLSSFSQANYFVKQCGFNLHDTMGYCKLNPMPVRKDHKRYAQQFEYAFVLSKGSPKTFNPIMEKCKYAGESSRMFVRQKDGSIKPKPNKRVVKDEKIIGNLWFYRVGYMHSSKNKIAFEHPAIFPEDLAKDHIKSWSNKNDLVFDPMCGSGTTLYAAKVLNRNFIGCDISKDYCKLARKRVL